MCISAPDATAARGAQGVIVYFRVVDGAVRVGDTVKLMKSRKEYQVDELGVLAPKPVQARACPRARARSRPRCWLWGAPRARARARGEAQLPRRDARRVTVWVTVVRLSKALRAWAEAMCEPRRWTPCTRARSATSLQASRPWRMRASATRSR